MTMSGLAKAIGYYWGNGWGRLVVVVTLMSGMGSGFYHIGGEVESLRQAVRMNTENIREMKEMVKDMSGSLWFENDHDIFEKGLRRELDDIKRNNRHESNHARNS